MGTLRTVLLLATMSCFAFACGAQAKKDTTQTPTSGANPCSPVPDTTKDKKPSAGDDKDSDAANKDPDASKRKPLPPPADGGNPDE